MRFKTIVITKRAAMAPVIIVLAAAALAVAVRAGAVKGVETFHESDIYEHILSEGLPDSGEKRFSIKEIINKAIGFDVDNPVTVIEEYSPVFGKSGAQDAQSTAEPTPAPTETPSSLPALPDKASICAASGLSLNNATDYDVDINALCAEELPFEVSDDGPQVLVVHTHTTECYDGDQMNGETERNTDESVNVIAVGEEICRVLEENGIKTIHDKTYHDYPSYQGSYTRALTTTEQRLAENPSIKIVLDVHRDAFVYEDGTKLKVDCDQNGTTAAQVMLVVGSDSMGLEHKNWRENLKFAAKIQNAAGIMYPNLMRPVNLRTERFNGHTTDGSLILEVGSNGNTLDEAKEGGRDVARAIAAVLLAK